MNTSIWRGGNAPEKNRKRLGLCLYAFNIGVSMIAVLVFAGCNDNGVGNSSSEDANSFFNRFSDNPDDGNSNGGGDSATTYTLNISANPTAGGTVSRNPSLSYYSAGAHVTITATPNTGYTFVSWTGAGVANATSRTTTVSMAANRNITANFNRQVANAIVITLTSWASTVSDGVGLPDPRIHFNVVAMQGSRELSRNPTAYLLDADEILSPWSGSRTSSVIQFDELASELRIYAVVVEKDAFFNDDISPLQYLSISLPAYHGDNRTGVSLGTSTSTQSRVGFNYEFRRQ